MNSGNHSVGGSVSADETPLVDPPIVSSVVAEASAQSQASEPLLVGSCSFCLLLGLL